MANKPRWFSKIAALFVVAGLTITGTVSIGEGVASHASEKCAPAAPEIVEDNYELPGTACLNVKVVDAKGKPVAGANILYLEDETFWFFGETNKSGVVTGEIYYTSEQKTTQLQVTHDSIGPWGHVFATQTIQLKPTTQNITIKADFAAKKSTIKAKFVDENGWPLKGIEGYLLYSVPLLNEINIPDIKSSSKGNIKLSYDSWVKEPRIEIKFYDNYGVFPDFKRVVKNLKPGETRDLGTIKLKSAKVLGNSKKAIKTSSKKAVKKAYKKPLRKKS